MATVFYSCKKDDTLHPKKAEYMGKKISFPIEIRFDRPVNLGLYNLSFSFIIQIYKVGATAPEETIIIQPYTVDEIQDTVISVYLHKGTTEFTDLRAYKLIGCQYSIGCEGHILVNGYPTQNWRVSFSPQYIPCRRYVEIIDGENRLSVNCILPPEIQ